MNALEALSDNVWKERRMIHIVHTQKETYTESLPDVSALTLPSIKRNFIN